MTESDATQSRASVLLLVWLVLTGIYAGTQPSLGEDLWWSLAAGRYITQHGAVPDRDPFSYTAEGEPWHNQEWLTQVLYWNVHEHLGGDALVLLKVGLVACFAVLLGWIGARRSGSWLLGSAAAVAALLIWGENLDLRAQLFTFIGTIVLLALLDAYRRGARGALIAVPLVLLLWVNLHYGFIFGLGVVLLYFVAETFKSLTGLPAHPLPMRSSLAIGVAFVAATLACLVNPQGLSALTFPFEILDQTSPWKEIVEWRPSRLVEDGAPSVFVQVVALQAVVAVVALWRKPARFDWTDLGLVTVTAAMAFSSRRFIALFGFVSAPFLARNLAIVVSDLIERWPAFASVTRRRAALASLVGLLGSIAVGVLVVTHARAVFAQGIFSGMTYADRFPRDAAEFLARNPIPGRVYNFYPWGGYLLYALPDRQVYMDGRAHAVYPPALWYERQNVEAATAASRRILDRRNVDLVVHMTTMPVALRMRTAPGWERVYDDGLATILVRETPETAPWLEKNRTGALWYPDTPGAQLFRGEVLARSGQKKRGVQEMLAVFDRYSEAGLQSAVQKLELETNASILTGDAGARQSAAALGEAIQRFSHQRQRR